MVLPLLAFPCDEARMARLGRCQVQPVTHSLSSLCFHRFEILRERGCVANNRKADVNLSTLIVTRTACDVSSPRAHGDGWGSLAIGRKQSSLLSEWHEYESGEMKQGQYTQCST